MVTFSSKTLSLLVLAALGLNVLTLFLLVATHGRRRRPLSAAGAATEDMLRAVLEGHAQALEDLEGAIRRLATEDQRIWSRLAGTVQKVGLLRYDAFEDVGGQMSFSCAMLDEQGDGVVITSINGRQDTRVYAKPVRGGSSDHNLSQEEDEVIRVALERPMQKVEAG
jgi:hypothetical protein